MKDQSEWYDSIATEVQKLKNTLGERNYKKYKLSLLLGVAQKVDELSLMCGQCKLFQNEIKALIGDINGLAQQDNRETRKKYFKELNTIVNHLKKQHKLVAEGDYMMMWMVIGMPVGLALGAASGHVGSGLPFGMCIGIAVGAWLDKKARKEGRVINPRQAAVHSPALMLIIMIGVMVLVGLVAFMLFRRS